jgi:hypothetical protein
MDRFELIAEICEARKRLVEIRQRQISLPGLDHSPFLAGVDLSTRSIKDLEYTLDKLYDILEDE